MKRNDENMLFDVIMMQIGCVLVFSMLGFVWVSLGWIKNGRMLSKVQKMALQHVGTGSCMGRNRVPH